MVNPINIKPFFMWIYVDHLLLNCIIDELCSCVHQVSFISVINYVIINNVMWSANVKQLCVRYPFIYSILLEKIVWFCFLPLLLNLTTVVLHMPLPLAIFTWRENHWVPCISWWMILRLVLMTWVFYVPSVKGPCINFPSSLDFWLYIWICWT